MHIAELWPIVGTILLTDFLRYFLAAGLAFLILWKWLRPYLEHRRINPRYPTSADLRREFQYSLLTVLIFAANGFMVYALSRNGTLKLYSDVHAYGWTYWIVSLIGVVVLQDAYFYATHWLMHRRALFRWVHAVHHRSRNPSPWAAYAFHPLEAIVLAVFLPLVLLVVPLHVAVVVLFLLHMIVRNVLGHSGFELYPRGAYVRPIWRWLTGGTHHHLHHETLRGNYGLYFTWWDRWLGTEQARYRGTMEEITSRSRDNLLEQRNTRIDESMASASPTNR